MSIASFEAHGHDFWQIDGPYRTLHQINPARIEFIERFCQLEQKKVLDLGCGGGILSEALARKGAFVTGIDLSASVLAAAKNHLQESKLNIDYRLISSSELAESGEKFELITCLEMLEHVDNIGQILRDIKRLINKNGLVFFSTINRTWQAKLFAVDIAESIGLIPSGTHDYHKFIRPQELVKMSEVAGFKALALAGLNYSPLTKSASLSRNLNINYLYVAQAI